MRRSICYCEPTYARAGEEKTWRFVYTPSISLPKGTCLLFDILSDGRDIDWEIPEVNLKKSRNIIFIELENGKSIQGKEIWNEDRFTQQYEFILPNKIEAGDAFSIVIGSPKKNEGGSKAQHYTQRRRPFHLYVDTTGKKKYGEPELFTMDIRGNDLATIRVLTPSIVARNKRFDVVVRFEDRYGNLTSFAPPETLIEISYEQLRENLNWKLFIPETGFIALPNLYFNESGIYTLRLRNTSTNEIFRSPPIKCYDETTKNIYWGVIHGESERYDSTVNIENCLRHFRDDKTMNFYTVSPFEYAEETPNDLWKLITQNIADFDESDRFVTFLGCQWQGIKGEEGIRQFIFSKDNKPILRKKDPKYSSLKKIYKAFTPKEVISIPSFTLSNQHFFDFKHLNPEFERVVEIYNAWGSSECTEEEGNPRPIKSPEKKGPGEAKQGSIIEALKNNYRFGFIAGGLDDRGIYNDFFESDQIQYSPGVTAIISEEHNRQSLFDALYRRSCYATTGERIILGLYIAGSPMGTELNTREKPGLLVNRHLSGYVAGTTSIKAVEIIRNGQVIKSFESEDYALEFTFDDMEPLEKITLTKDKVPPFVFYYLRVTQDDGGMAWSSPIWIDHIPPQPGSGFARKALLSKKKVEVEVEEAEEDEDFDYEES